MAEDLVGKVVLVHLDRGMAAGILEKVTETSIRLSNACDFVGCDQLNDSESYLINCLENNMDIINNKPLQNISYFQNRIQRIELFETYYKFKQHGNRRIASS